MVTTLEMPLSLKLAKRFYHFAVLIACGECSKRLKPIQPDLAERYQVAADYLMLRIYRESTKYG